MAGLKSTILLDVAQESGDEHDGGQVHELKCKNGQAKKNNIPAVEEGEA